MNALIYCRVSTNKQEEQGASLASQERACLAHAKALGFTVGGIVKETFSGAQLWERPMLARARRDIAYKKYQAIIVYSLDRLSRDRAHLKIITSEIERAGAILISVTESLNGITEGQFAEAELQKIQERCVRGKRHRALSGLLHNSGTELYGYRRDKQSGVRAIYEPEAQVIRRIYEWMLEGVSIRQIVIRLNEEGIPSPSIGKRVYRDGRKAYWGKGSIRRILTDPAYKGESWSWRFKSATQPGQTIAREQSEWIRLPDETTPAIVTIETWQIVQDRLKANLGNRVRPTQRLDLLRGFIFCGVCGRKLHAQNEHGGYRVYRCSSRTTPHGPCGGKRVPASDCESSVWEMVMNTLRDTKGMTLMREERMKEIQSLSTQLQADLEAARREFKRLEDEQVSLAQSLCESLDEKIVPIIEMHIAQITQDKFRFRDLVCEIESLISSEGNSIQGIIRKLTEVQVDDFSVDYTFEEKRQMLQFFGVRVIGNGRDWQTSDNI